jgi:hypothetical protein
MTKKTETELYHGTFTITRTWLVERNACQASLTALDASGLLPITISTDPDENVDLADELVQTPAYPKDRFGAGGTVTRWVEWLIDCLAVFNFDEDVWIADSPYPRGPILEQVDYMGQYGANDPTLLAQILAMIADAYLMTEGR